MKIGKYTKTALAAATVSLLLLNTAHTETLKFTGTLRTQLPTINITNSSDPVSDVKEATISVSQNGGVCNVTSDVNIAMSHGSKPVCLIEWDDPNGLSQYLNTLRGVVSGSGTHSFTYTLKMYDFDSFKPLQSSSYEVVFQQPLLPDEPILTSSWTIQDDTTATTHDIFSRNESHNSLTADTTPRNYDQVIKFGNLSCTIPEGDTSCTIVVNETFAETENIVGTKVEGFTVTDPYDFIQQDPNQYTYNWDFRPPEIVSTHVNTSSNMLPEVISDYGDQDFVLMHNQAAVVIQSPHSAVDEAFYPTDPTLVVRQNNNDIYVTNTVNYGGVEVTFDLGTSYGENDVVVQPINEPLRIDNYLLYVYDFSHIRDGLYDFTFSTKDGNDNGDQEVVSEIYIDRYPPDIQFLVNDKQLSKSAKPNIYSLSDITVLSWGGWDDGARITSALLNGESVNFEGGTDNVKRIEHRALPLNTHNYLSVTTEDATGNEYTRVLDFHYGYYQFSVSAPDVMQSVQPATITLNQSAGPYCMVTTSAELAKLASINATSHRIRGCTIEWLEIPEGLDPLAIKNKTRSANILASGNISGEGAQNFHFKVHAYDKYGASQVVFEHSGTFSTFAMQVPEVYVGPVTIAQNFPSYRHSLSVDRQLMIQSTIKAQAGADVVIELYDETGQQMDSYESLESRSSFWHRFIPNTSLEPLTAYDYKVRVYYKQHPELYVEKPYNFFTVPGNNVQLKLTHPEYVMDGSSIQVTANMGSRSASAVSYSADMGEWDVGFYVVDPNSFNLLPLSSTVRTDANGIARLSISSEDIMNSERGIFARAELVTPYPDVDIRRQVSALYNVPVLSLGGIDATLEANTYQASAPARFLAAIDYKTVLDRSTAGDVVWQTSPDSDNWVEVARKPELTNYLFTMENPGELYVRAIVVNRLNGEQNYTNTVHFVAKNLPTLEIQGSHLVVENGVGVYNYLLNQFALNNLVGSVEYSVDSKLSWQPMSPTQQIQIDRTGDVIARALIHPDGEAPYYIYAERFVRAVPPRQLGAYFSADIRRAEAGETANINVRFHANQIYRQDDVRYYVQSPDGEQHQATELSYQLQASDFVNGKAVFTLRSWVDGLALETTGEKTISIDEIVYNELPPTDIFLNSDERVQYSYFNVNLARPNRNLIPANVTIEHEITLPDDDLELMGQSVSSYRVIAKEVGTHPIQVRFFDNRGFEREHTIFITVTEPGALTFEMDTRYHTEHLRPPFRYSTVLRYRFGSPTDSLKHIEWYLNGQLVDTNRRTITNNTLHDPGEYTVTAKIFSNYGQTAEETTTFTLLPNQAPECSPYWEQRDANVKTLFANCTDYDGRVMRVGFTYALNESLNTTTYRYYNPSISFLDGYYLNTVPIKMVVLDDSDKEVEFDITWP